MKLPQLALASLGIATLTPAAQGHGDVSPQPVNTSSLPDVGDKWLSENPYRNDGKKTWNNALNIGASGYNQNCARCHGLQAISGGLAPDLRFLEAEEYGDEWYVERFRYGYTQNSITKMPAFGKLLGQKAAWAIRTYIEARPDDQDMNDASAQLEKIRNTLKIWAQYPPSPQNIRKISGQLKSIADNIKTLSGAPIADSSARRAWKQLNQKNPSFNKAAEILTISLSATK